MHAKTDLFWVTNGKIIPSVTEELVGTKKVLNIITNFLRGRMWPRVRKK